MGAFLLYGFLFISLIFIRIMNLFSDPSFIQISLVLLLLIGIAVYARQFKAIGALIVVYFIYTAVSVLTTKNDNPKLTQTFIESASDSAVITQVAPEDNLHDTLITETVDKQQSLTIENEKDQDAKSLELNSISQDTVFSNLEFHKMVICKSVFSETRSPDGISVSFPDTVGRVYCFIMVGNPGRTQTVTHEWTYEETLISTIPMEIGRSHYWRAWSYQTIQPHKTGNWSVAVRNADGNLLASASFTVHSTRIDN